MELYLLMETVMEDIIEEDITDGAHLGDFYLL